MIKKLLKLIAVAASILVPSVSHAFVPVRYVQISTNTLSPQSGGFKTSSGTVTDIFNATGTVNLGGVGTAVTISSNAITPTATFYSNAPILISTFTKFTAGNGTLGSVNGVGACIGCVGEVISTATVYSAATPLTSGGTRNIGTISLTPGNWLVTVQGSAKSTNAGTSITNVTLSVSVNSNTIPGTDTIASQDTVGQVRSDNTSTAVIPGNGGTVMAAPVSSIVKISSPSSYFGTIQVTFTVSTATGFGSITAVRLP